jgi:hypothetical protein
MFASELFFGGTLYSEVQKFCMQQHSGWFLAASFAIDVV